jgi:hypothetical protein
MKVAEIVKMADEFVKMTKRAKEEKAGPGHLLTRSEVFGGAYGPEWRALLDDSKWKEKLHGGDAEGMVPSDFDAEELLRGGVIEFEHTNDKRIALQISADHLSADPNYYRKLQMIDPEDFEKMDQK